MHTINNSNAFTAVEPSEHSSVQGGVAMVEYAFILLALMSAAVSAIKL